MPQPIQTIKRVLQGPPLPPEAIDTYRFHRLYAVMDAAAGGILLNTPIYALKILEASEWQLPMRELGAGIGMLGGLYMGSWMARRPKRPFVVIPGVICAAFALSMALVQRSSFWFLLLLTISAAFEIVTRPAVTAILRFNYPVECRAAAVGDVRRWSSLAFLVASFLSAYDYHNAGQNIAFHVRTQILLAGSLSLGSFLCFRMIRVREQPACRNLQPELLRCLKESLLIVLRDRRYCRYLAGCFLDGSSQLLYYSMLWAFFDRTLGYGFFGCVMLMHTLPAMMAFLVTGAFGRWVDRTNPWLAWALVRLCWGADALLLAATPFCAALLPPALYILPVTGRLIRGSVQGAWWIMWWQIGVTYFAPPGEDTSRYMGIMTFLNGATRLAGSGLSVALGALGVPPIAMMLIGGAGVLASGAYSLLLAYYEQHQHVPETIAQFEHQFNSTGR